LWSCRDKKELNFEGKKVLLSLIRNGKNESKKVELSLTML
jgi:hypothetical protein